MSQGLNCFRSVLAGFQLANDKIFMNYVGSLFPRNSIAFSMEYLNPQKLL